MLSGVSVLDSGHQGVDVMWIEVCCGVSQDFTLGSGPGRHDETASSASLEGRQAESFVEGRDDHGQALVVQVSKPQIVCLHKCNTIEHPRALKDCHFVGCRPSSTDIHKRVARKSRQGL